jgi:hypothetical protein
MLATRRRTSSPASPSCSCLSRSFAFTFLLALSPHHPPCSRCAGGAAALESSASWKPFPLDTRRPPPQDPCRRGPPSHPRSRAARAPHPRRPVTREMRRLARQATCCGAPHARQRQPPASPRASRCRSRRRRASARRCARRLALTTGRPRTRRQHTHSATCLDRPVAPDARGDVKAVS